MIKRSILITTLFACVSAAIGVMFFYGCSSSENPEKTQAEQSGNQKQPSMVKVVPAGRSSISKTLELTGSVEPYRVAGLASPAEGPVARVLVREGDRVAAGAPLIYIGRKKGVDALIVSLKEDLKKEEDNLNRTRQLVEDQALPGEELDRAVASYEKARASLIRAEETALDYVINAPWAGLVSRVNVKEGEFVAPRAELLEIYDSTSLVIRASIPEKHAAKVPAGMQVDVRLDAYPDMVIPGRVERIYPYLDSRLRTRTVEITLEKSVDLLPGMFARLVLSLENAEDVVVVPLEALVATPEGQVVFVFEQGKAHAKKVKTGIESDNRIEIISGIRPEDKVIVAGNEKLKNGADVRLAGEEKTGKGQNETNTETPVEKSGKAGEGR